MHNYAGALMQQLTINQLLEALDLTPTQDLDSPVQSTNTKLELLTSAYLDHLNSQSSSLTVDQAHILKILFELAR